jgi:hypothetical protein
MIVREIARRRGYPFARVARGVVPFAGFDFVQRLVLTSTRTFGSGATIDFAETG